mgnify:CR=1 FL=1
MPVTDLEGMLRTIEEEGHEQQPLFVMLDAHDLAQLILGEGEGGQNQDPPLLQIGECPRPQPGGEPSALVVADAQQTGFGHALA